MGEWLVFKYRVEDFEVVFLFWGFINLVSLYLDRVNLFF